MKELQSDRKTWIVRLGLSLPDPVGTNIFGGFCTVYKSEIKLLLHILDNHICTLYTLADL